MQQQHDVSLIAIIIILLILGSAIHDGYIVRKRHPKKRREEKDINHFHKPRTIYRVEENQKN